MTNNVIPGRIHARPVPRPGRIVGGVIVAVLAAMLIHGLVTNPEYRWGTVWMYLRDVVVMRGVGFTLILTFGSMAIACVMAVTLAVMRRSDNPITRWVATAYIWFFRGTPVYVQLVFWGFIAVLYPRLSLGVPFGPELFVFTTRDLISTFWAALLGLAFNEAAYLAEIVRTGINSVDPGQEEAAKALGMKPNQILARVTLPQAMRVIVPPTGNETISMLKTTSLVVAVPFTQELYFAAQQLGNRLFQPIPFLVIAAIWYLAITSVLMVGQHYLEQYFGRGFGAQGSSGRRRSRFGRPTRGQAIAAAGTVAEDPFIEYTP
jgi:polar amino acid transport system permease protein